MIPNQIKRSMRSAVDRVALPYVDLVVARLEPGAVPADDAGGAPSATAVDFVPSDYFHNLLHTLRTMSLRTLPKDVDRVLSIGASGRWYFDWFEQNVAAVSEHVGVEAFEEQPPDLPEYVTWIANTADQMVDVPTASIDLVFAGQTVEHLWAHELVGFLVEAHRVLRPGGYLVVDSPNRLVTEYLYWSHGGHTIEISAAEMNELLALAGFVTLSTAGLWSCVVDGEIVGLEHRIDEPAVLVERIVHGQDHPDDCFVWWINAERSDVGPDVAALTRRVDELFDANWQTRVNRGLFPRPGVTTLPVPRGSTGEIGSTLPFPLPAGTVRVVARLAEGDWSQVAGFSIRFVAPGDQEVRRLEAESAERIGDRLEWVFDQPWLLFAVELRLGVRRVDGDVTIALPVEVRCGD